MAENIYSLNFYDLSMPSMLAWEIEVFSTEKKLMQCSGYGTEYPISARSELMHSAMEFTYHIGGIDFHITLDSMKREIIWVDKGDGDMVRAAKYSIYGMKFHADNEDPQPIGNMKKRYWKALYSVEGTTLSTCVYFIENTFKDKQSYNEDIENPRFETKNMQEMLDQLFTMFYNDPEEDSGR